MRLAGASQLVERSPSLSFLNYTKGQLLHRLGLRSHRSGATHAGMSVEESVAYVRRVTADYLTYGEMPEAELDGLRVLEIGPGDNLGVALSLVAKGVDSVVCLDRFEPLRDEVANGRIYRRLYELSSRQERARIDDAARWRDDGTVTFDRRRLICCYGVAVENAPTILSPGSFDLIVSRAVLEHVFDVEAAWAAMVDLLSEGGRMWHKVDFRNHGFFDSIHPLYFLTLRERAWSAVSAPDPTLNRKRLPSYRRLASDFPWSKIWITHLLGNDERLPHLETIARGREYGPRELALVDAIRPKLVPPFREMSDEDLLVEGVFVVCRKAVRR